MIFQELFTALLDVAEAFDRVCNSGLVYELKTMLPPAYFLCFK